MICKKKKWTILGWKIGIFSATKTRLNVNNFIQHFPRESETSVQLIFQFEVHTTDYLKRSKISPNLRILRLPFQFRSFQFRIPNSTTRQFPHMRGNRRGGRQGPPLPWSEQGPRIIVITGQESGRTIRRTVCRTIVSN